MRKLTLLALCLFATVAVAQTPSLERLPFGSGQPGMKGFENSIAMDNNVFFAPQYMPDHPTAATIWPRVVEVPCKQGPKGLLCEGYNWTPKMGRAEYLFFRPVVIAPTPPAPCCVVQAPPQIIREIREVEVERKKNRQ